MRLLDTEALRVAAAEALQMREHLLLLDALRDDRELQRLRDAQDCVHFRARDVARQELARDAAVDLDELHAELLDRHEGHRATAEAVDEHRAADGTISSGEARRLAEPEQRIAFVDLEKQLLRGDVIRRQLRRDVTQKLAILECLAVHIHGKARDARAARKALDSMAHHPAI